jgi:hypothetical protein
MYALTPFILRLETLDTSAQPSPEHPQKFRPTRNVPCAFLPLDHRYVWSDAQQFACFSNSALRENVTISMLYTTSPRRIPTCHINHAPISKRRFAQQNRESGFAPDTEECEWNQWAARRGRTGTDGASWTRTVGASRTRTDGASRTRTDGTMRRRVMSDDVDQEVSKGGTVTFVGAKHRSKVMLGAHLFDEYLFRRKL